MAQINQKNKGISLIELIVYMSICSILFFSIISSVFYIQKIIQASNQDYYVRNQIYANLNLLQDYLYRSHASIQGKTLQFFDKKHSLILTQGLEGGFLKNSYSQKVIFPMPYVHFQEYDFEFDDSGRILKVQFSWLDNKGRAKTIIEYLIVINQNL